MAGLHLDATVERNQSIDHVPAGIGAAGVLEVCPILQAGVGEGGELATGVLDVESFYGLMGSGAMSGVCPDQDRLTRVTHIRGMRIHGCRQLL